MTVKTLMLSVVTYRSEIWSLRKADAARLTACEMRVGKRWRG